MAGPAAQVQSSSALMKNQKAAQLVGDLSAFEAVQTAEGLGLLFSIGDDEALHLCVEQVGADVVWEPLNLTADLGVEKLVARSFAVFHDPAAGTIGVAQVVRGADGSDRLYVLGGLSDKSESDWMTAAGKREWVARPCDGAAAGGSGIAYVHLAPAPGTGLCVAGIAAADTGFVSNFTVDLDPAVTEGVWQRFETAEDFESLLDSAIGRPQGALEPGLYELVSQGEELGLTFTPISDGAAPVRKLAAPAGASAVAALPADGEGHTHLFVAGGSGVQLFPAAGQGREAAGIEVLASPLFAEAASLEARADAEHVTLWARNGQGQVVSCRAPVAAIEDPSAWSPPIPILAGAEQIAAVGNLATGASEIYVHGSERTLTKLEQDPVTTEWRRQAMTLPPSALADMVEVFTFTTHLNLLDASSLPSPAATVELRSTSPCSVYVEGAHTRLSADTPVEVSAGAGGTVTIVQQTDTLAAVPYLVTDASGRVTEVNPMGPALGQLGEVREGADLDRTVTDEQGNSSPLVPPGVSSGEKQAVASAIAELHGTAATLPPGAPTAPLLPATALVGAAAGSSWSLSFAGGGVRFERGAPGYDAEDVLEAWWGDLVLWVEHALEEVTKVVVTVAEGVAHVLVEIAGEVYHAVLRCLADAMATFQLILHKLIAAFQTLVAWLGMILNWEDILRTHAVLKSVIGSFLRHAVAELPSYRKALDEQFASLERRIEAGAGLKTVSASAGSMAGSKPPSAAQLHPATGWGGYQHARNIGSAKSDASVDLPEGDRIEQLLHELGEALAKEGEDVEKAIEQIKSVFEEAGALPLGEIVEKLLAIVAELALETLQVILDAVFAVLEFAAAEVVSAVEEPIEIPVLSPLYERFTDGDKLSFLDLGCLVAAIPATIGCKLAKGHTPFPDDDFTRALIDAGNLEEIRRLFAESGAEAVLAAPDADSRQQIWNFVVGFVAFGSSFAVALLSAFKQAGDSCVTSIAYAVAYLFYCAPCYMIFTEQTWDVIFNEALTAISVVKTLVDVPLYKYNKASEGQNGPFLEKWKAASPIVEFVIDGVWMVPTFGPLCRKHDRSIELAVAGGVLFNLAGMGALPLSLIKDEPTGEAILVVAIMVLSIGYGFLMEMSSEAGGVPQRLDASAA